MIKLRYAISDPIIRRVHYHRLSPEMGMRPYVDLRDFGEMARVCVQADEPGFLCRDLTSYSRPGFGTFGL
jgi:hypothetical protein